MSEPAVLFEAADLVGVLTLNRPDNRNSMTPELLDAFEAAVDTAVARPDLRAVVITGKGPCFSAGADFKSVVQRGHGTPPERSFQMYRPFLRILDIEVPVIAAIQGHAVGGGFGLALLSDIRIASEEAKLGANFTRLGLHPGMAVSYLLPRLVGVSKAQELLYTGSLVRGSEAERIGLVSRSLPAGQVLDAAMDMAATIAESAPLAVRMTKRTLYRMLEWDPRGAAETEAFSQAVTLSTDDVQEGISALLEKRAPRFRGR